MTLILSSQPEEGILVVTLNDPDNLNAMSDAMAAEFSALMHKLAGDIGKIRAVILTGAGRAFSAGGHLEMLEKKRSIPEDENRKLMRKFYGSFLSLLDVGVPFIAAINGSAVGAGLCVACACDIRVAANEAKLGFTFTKLGLHPGMGATFFVPQVLGTARARELLLTGRVVTSAEALEMGLVSQRVPSADVMNAALTIAREIKTCGPQATAQLLQSLRNPIESLDGALEREATFQGVNYASAEFGEGISAVREKRPAKF